MPRPRAPTRELFEFTNRRRAGGKCDLYRCKRCGREMLENTHRFAIHISICKKASDEDREVAKSQLRKTKKYNTRADNVSALPAPESGCRQSGINVQYSPPRLYDRQELLMPTTLYDNIQEELLMPPATTMKRLMNDYHQSQQDRIDMFDGRLEPAATAFETVTRGATTVLSDLEDHYRMAASSMFDSRYYDTAAASRAQQMAAHGGVIFGSHHQSATAPAVMFNQRPHHTVEPRQRYQMPPTNHQQWGSFYSSPFQSPASAHSMGDLQPYMF